MIREIKTETLTDAEKTKLPEGQILGYAKTGGEEVDGKSTSDIRITISGCYSEIIEALGRLVACFADNSKGKFTAYDIVEDVKQEVIKHYSDTARLNNKYPIDFLKSKGVFQWVEEEMDNMPDGMKEFFDLLFGAMGEVFDDMVTCHCDNCDNCDNCTNGEAPKETNPVDGEVRGDNHA